MNSSKLSKRILDCLECKDESGKEEIAIYNELSQVNSYIIRAVIVRLCEKIEQLKKENGGRII